MNVGELIRCLSEYCPDTEVQTVDGNLITSELNAYFYGEAQPGFVDQMNDGFGGRDDVLYLMVD